MQKKICKAKKDFSKSTLVLVEESEGPYPNSTEVIGKSSVYLDEAGPSLKSQAGFLILHDKCCSRERKSTDRLRCAGYA